MTNADALAAIDKLRQFDELFEFVHIVGESTAAMWAAVSTAQAELETQRHKPLLFILEAGKIGTDESVDDYALRLEAEKKKLKNKNIAVVAARSLYVKMDGTTAEVNNASILCGLLAKTNVQQSVGRTREAAGMGISKDKMLELRPAGIKEYIELLDSAKYITFREYDGLEGFYVTNARVMSPDGSDYRYIEDVRVVNKIVREVRKAGLPLLQEDIDVEDTQGELERRAKYMEAPLDEMVRAKEISSAQITVPEGQDIIKDERMDVVVRYVWEWAGGFRVLNGEIQIIPHNNAGKHLDQSATSTQWKAILQDGTLVAPGTTGTLKFDNSVAGDATQTNHKIGGTMTISTTRANPLYTGGDVNDYFGYQDQGFESLAAKSGVTIPMLLKLLGIAPPATGLGGDHFWCRNYGERHPLRGGSWYYGVGAGVFALAVLDARAFSYPSVGFRAAFVNL